MNSANCENAPFRFTLLLLMRYSIGLNSESRINKTSVSSSTKHQKQFRNYFARPARLAHLARLISSAAALPLFQ